MFKSNSFTHHQVSSGMPARWHPARQQQLLDSAGVASRQQAPSCSSSVFARGPNRGVAARAAATDIELEEYQADNFYEILGVGPLSSPKDIKRAYKTMVCCLPDLYCLLYLLQHVMLALDSWLLHNQHCLLFCMRSSDSCLACHLHHCKLQVLALHMACCTYTYTLLCLLPLTRICNTHR